MQNYCPEIKSKKFASCHRKINECNKSFCIMDELYHSRWSCAVSMLSRTMVKVYFSNHFCGASDYASESSRP